MPPLISHITFSKLLNFPLPREPQKLGIIKVEWGEGITGTSIMVTWTKSRGRVEVGKGGGFGWGRVEGWREKACNCN